jgi:hypothetical protein
VPSPGELPEDIRALTRKHAQRISHETFRADVDRLIAVIEKILSLDAERSALDEAESRAKQEEEERREKEEFERRLHEDEATRLEREQTEIRAPKEKAERAARGESAVPQSLEQRFPFSLKETIAIAVGAFTLLLIVLSGGGKPSSSPSAPAASVPKQEPGLYAGSFVRQGERITSSMVRLVSGEMKSDGPKSIEEVGSEVCVTRNISSGDRLSWADVDSCDAVKDK